MARTYSSPSYGAHSQVSMFVGELNKYTNAGVATSGAMFRFMFPCEVLSFNMCCVSSAEDLTNTTEFRLSHRYPAVSTECTEFGTASLDGVTGTHASGGTAVDGTVHGGTASESFLAGEECVLEIEGTGDTASGEWMVSMEIVEKFVESDS